MKKLLLVSIAACFLLSCNSKKKEETISTPSEIKDVESTESVLGKVIVYEGLLPCVNCDGIETTLKIYQSDDTTRTHTFELTSIYKSKGPERKFVEKGSYNIEKGVGNDRERTIYVLDFINWDHRKLSLRSFTFINTSQLKSMGSCCVITLINF